MNDLGHFEEIGLDEDPEDRPRLRGATNIKPPQRANTGPASLRDLTLKRPPYPSLQPHLNSVSSSDHLGLPNGSRRGSTLTLPNGRRSRNSSPGPQSQSCPQSPALSAVSSLSSTSSSHRSFQLPDRLRRGSFSRRKTAAELEKECDSDGDDEIPVDLILGNIPLSPRRLSQSISASTSPDREHANGSSTPRPGLSRSPPRNGTSTPGSADIRVGRAIKSRHYTDAIVEELSPEARELTEKLEEYAEKEMLREERRRQKLANPNAQNSRSAQPSPSPTKRVELPPLQMTNGMIDPLPISKEKEAVLSRTRPSWLPPKSKDEEKRHLREYQKMMQKALQAGTPHSVVTLLINLTDVFVEQKKVEKEREELERREKLKVDIHRVWEKHIIPDWDKMIGRPETRELWWRGVAPMCRAVVWEKALGNHLAVTEETFHLALARAKELEKGKGSIQITKDQEMFNAIRRDVSETYPDLMIFQVSSGQYCDSLVSDDGE